MSGRPSEDRRVGLALRMVCLLSTLAHTDTARERDGWSKMVISLESLYVWLSVWERKAETLEKFKYYEAIYLQVQPAESVMESRKRRPVCVCVLCGRQMSTAT